MDWIQKTALLALIVLLSACGKKPAEVMSAPETQGHAGIIGACASVEEAKSLAKSHGIRYRVINAKRQLIEFYDIDEAGLKSALPRVKTRPNTVYEGQLVQAPGAAPRSFGDYPFFGAHHRQYRFGDVSGYFPHLVQVEADHPIENVQGEGVVVAVIDTGVHYNHPHLSPNIHTNPDDLHGDDANGLDDDGNGFADDYVGWDFYNGDAYPIDDHGHGTHVAGIVAGTYGGIAPKARILPVKVLSSQGRGDLATIAAGILYAVDRGADIINLSLGGPGAGQASKDLRALLGSVVKADESGSLLVAAAGNGGDDQIGDCNDAQPIYPASFDQKNVMAVASVDRHNLLTSYSNFGKHSVHIAAPGGEGGANGIRSLGLPYCYGPCGERDLIYAFMSGTSMAAPVVAGIAALVKSARPDLSPKEIKELIMETGDFEPTLKEKVKSSKVANARQAVEAALAR